VTYGLNPRLVSATTEKKGKALIENWRDKKPYKNTQSRIELAICPGKSCFHGNFMIAQLGVDIK
jgi:hypothetical protein